MDNWLYFSIDRSVQQTDMWQRCEFKFMVGERRVFYHPLRVRLTAQFNKLHS